MAIEQCGRYHCLARTRRPSLAEPMDNPTIFTDFKGVLSAEGHTWRVQLRARVDETGEFELEFSPMERSQETVPITQIFQSRSGSVVPFRLVADAADGTHLETDHLILVGITSGNGSLELRFKCLKGVFSKPCSDVEVPVIHRALRGFECWTPVRAPCALGVVAIAGAMGPPTGDKITGSISIRALAAPEDEQAWLDQAERLLTHIRWVLSFAAGVDLKAPTTTRFASKSWTLEVFSQAPMATGGLAVVHGADLSSIFNAAVASFFAPPIQAERLYFAIEWFVTPARHKETRLTNAMTALENLVNSNLGEEEICLLPPKRFVKMAKLMRQALKDDAKATLERDPPGMPVSPEVASSRAAEEAFRNALVGKMLDLNRRPLADKTQLLIERWRVPAQDLSRKALAAAIGARNLVVHEGYYADHPKGGPDRGDLWDHIFTTREIVERIIMAVIGYEGAYVNCRAGHTAQRFPPSGRHSGLGV